MDKRQQTRYNGHKRTMFFEPPSSLVEAVREGRCSESWYAGI